ncbi:MAG: Fic family protein [Thermoleophilaceae bacterium]
MHRGEHGVLPHRGCPHLAETARPQRSLSFAPSRNWIGGNDYNPVGADYVPPPPEFVPELLEDLSSFIARDVLAPVAQAAIAHAQFENIHPFADGNGRTGRALVYTVLRRRGETDAFIPPMSLVLASQPKGYGLIHAVRELVGQLPAYPVSDVSFGIVLARLLV